MHAEINLSTMYTFFIILIVILAILLTGLVLVQNSKGGGLASSFSSGNQVLGVRKTTDFLEKATWSLVGLMALLCILTVGFHSGKTASEGQDAIINQQVENIEAGQVADVPAFDENATEAPAEDAE